MDIPTRNEAEQAIEKFLPYWFTLSSTWQSVIIRDIVHKGTHYRSDWVDLDEFVSNYIETVNSVFTSQFPSNGIRWEFWGNLLHNLERAKMYSQLKWNYKDIHIEFRHLIPEWEEIPAYAQDATIRDALNRGNEFWRFWDNMRKLDKGNPITAFVKNYIEVVESLLETTNTVQMWTQWGTTLRLLEVSN